MVQFVRWTSFASGLIDAERFLPGFVVDLRCHIVVVKEDAFVCAFGLHVRRRDRADSEIGLRIPLLEDAGSKVTFAIAVHVLTIHRLCDSDVVFPCLWRFQTSGFQNILAIVDHLEVTIDGDQIGFATDLLVKFAEVGRDVVNVDLVVIGDIGVQWLDKSAVN